MNNNKNKIHALCLLSGGLDSQLAVCVLKEQGIEVHGLVFETPFFGAETGVKAAAACGIDIKVVDFTEDIITLLNGPKHGFGSHMNPCIDCHMTMIKIAGKIMEDKGYHFLATGEVLNERPMSQNRRSLEVVAKGSGYDELLLRPLSAKLLPETKPEKEGWVDRSRLFDLSGRGRKPQFALAEKYGLKDYPSPAGGCKLTEPHFSKRLADLKKNDGLDDIRKINLLKYGRHFRLSSEAKAIVGRDHAENLALENIASKDDYLLVVEGYMGPMTLVTYDVGDDMLLEAAELCVLYGDAPADEEIKVKIVQGVTERYINVKACSKEEAKKIIL